MKKNKFNYYLYLDSVLFRIPCLENGENATITGDTFDKQNGKWHPNVETMRMLMSGEYSKLTFEEAMNRLK